MNLYETIANNAKNETEAYEIVFEYVESYFDEQLVERNIEDENLIKDLYDKVFSKESFDYGFITEEEAYTYISNIIDNEMILIKYKNSCNIS